MKFNIYILTLVSFLIGISACTVEQPILDDSSQIAVDEGIEVNPSALTYNKGIIDDFSGEIWSWWVGNDQISLSRKGDTLKAVLKNIGPKYTPFGREFNTIDFTEGQVLKVRMRAEGEKPPLVGISLKDVNSFDTNADRPKVKVKISNVYEDYYFNYTDRWRQSWPNNQIVDIKSIKELLIFINPGGAEWSGTLYIDEIRVVKESDMPKVEVAAGGIIDDFSEEIYSWWSSSDKIALERKNDILNVTCTAVGSGYETFGKGIDPINMAGDAHIVRVKARAEGDAPYLRINLKDKSGYVNNENPIVIKIDVSDTFKNYYFDFKDSWKQSYPDFQIVNPEFIQEILLFINPGGNPTPYTGVLYIDELEVIDEKKMNELKSNE